MAILNLEELKKQIKEGTFTCLESLENEFKTMLKEVLQEIAQEELTSHLGYEKNQISNITNSRNGYNKKKLNSKYGQVNLEIPRDRDSSFEPQLIKKRETILDGTEDLIISLYAKGMSVRDIQLHLDDLYGYELSTETISNMTNKVLELAKDWKIEL
ncbi:MAG: transposase [Campylobacteraceae bacterium]|nr:transposase [Campylobacteraceae bacterium]